MPVSVYNGSAWVPAKQIPVFNGSSWVNAKKIKVWNGTSWVLAWVPPVTGATLSFSKNGVNTGEAYNVILTAPNGFPEGARVTFSFPGYSWSTDPAEGSTSAALPGASHPTVGNVTWTATVTTKGGDTSFGPITQTVTSAQPPGIYTDSGSYQGVGGGTGLVNAMRAARSAGLTCYVKGVWTLELNTMWIPDGVNVVCEAGTKFNHIPMARFRNAAKWPAADMPDSCGGYDGGSFTWTGGEFDGGGDGIFTLSHSPGFTIQNTVMYNWSEANGDGHAIEINSSGGNNDLGGSAYRVHILNNQFLGLGLGQRTNSNDEAVQWDWAWKGSGVRGAEDHTMCHNIRIAGNTSHRLSESWDNLTNGGFSLCFAGGHRMSDASKGVMGNAGLANPSDGEPADRHNWVLLENNSIHKAVGSTAVSPDKGAIGLWNTRDVIVRNNQFFHCTANRLVSGWDKTQNLNSAACNISISGNKHNGANVTITMPADNTTG